MSVNYNLNKEGDINVGALREQWNLNLSDNIKQVLINDENVFIKQSMSTPCMNVIKEAEGCWITDLDGKKILDFHGNSLHQVGYKNKVIIDAVKNQMDELPFIPRRYTADIVIKAAEYLIEKTSSKNYKLLFTPSGSAAVGIALKVARKVTGNEKIISMWESFHGAGLDTISIGGESVFKKDMGSMLSGIIKAIPFNSYRNVFGINSAEETAKICLDYIEYIIEHEGKIGAIILEPVRATDTHIPPKEYFIRLREICDKNKIVLIFDEIPTGIGRSGEFYVHQNFGIEPDIIVLGKGLGGGVIPQAAVLIKKEYDVSEDISLGHYTHEKPALGAAAICALVKYIDDNKLIDKTKEHSIYIKKRAIKLMEKHSEIGDVRILGLLISFEIIKKVGSREKNEELAEKIMYFCLEKGFSFKVANGNCITWHPPLTVSKNEINFAFEVFESALLSIKT